MSSPYSPNALREAGTRLIPGVPNGDGVLVCSPVTFTFGVTAGLVEDEGLEQPLIHTDEADMDNSPARNKSIRIFCINICLLIRVAS